MEEQAKSGGLYSGLIDLDNLMDNGTNKSGSQSQQPMASMQQKEGAQPHPSSSTAQQEPNYTMGMGTIYGNAKSWNGNANSQNGIRHDANVSNVWTIWKNPGIQPQRPQ